MGADPSQLKDGRLLVLGAGPAQLGLLRAARERGLYVVACDRDSHALGFEYADRRAPVSTEDESAVARLAAAERVGGVISPGADWPVAIAARVAARLGLPHPLEPETAARTVTKLRQRELFDGAGVPQPRWRLEAEPEPEFELPCVVKPADRQGQRGLSVVHERAALAAAVERAVAESRSGSAIVEELVEGPEVTVNAFSVAGAFHALTVTDRLTADPPAFGVALAHAWPSAEVAAPPPLGGDRSDPPPTSSLSSRKARERVGSRLFGRETAPVSTAVDAARRAAEALGIENGPTYTQVRLTPAGPRVIELAARLGGGHDAELCRAALGVDLNGLALDAALGKELLLPASRPAGGACVRFLVAPVGTLAGVAGLVDALAVDGVVDAAVYRRAGWTFGPLLHGSDRAGYVLARGDSRDDALARAAAAAQCIRFSTTETASRFQLQPHP